MWPQFDSEDLLGIQPGRRKLLLSFVPENGKLIGFALHESVIGTSNRFLSPIMGVKREFEEESLTSFEFPNQSPRENGHVWLVGNYWLLN